MRSVKSRNKRLKRRSRLQRGGDGWKYAFDYEDTEIFRHALVSYNNDKDVHAILSVINDINKKYIYKSAAKKGMYDFLTNYLSTNDISIDENINTIYETINYDSNSNSGGKRSRKRRRTTQRRKTRKYK